MKLTHILCCLLTAGAVIPANGKELDVIPRVSQNTPLEGKFVLSNKTGIVLGQTPEESKAQMAFNVQQLETFLPAKLKSDAGAGSKNTISLMIKPERFKNMKQGSYALRITPTSIKIAGADAAGVFYAIQSLKQMLPSDVFRENAGLAAELTLPCVDVMDSPRFSYRGFMLDSCRHMQTVDAIKTYLDRMALYKMNVLHWHLTEDEAWRMEIKKYPKLMSIGSKPGTGAEGEELNGYYTKKQMKEVVAYAKSRYIKVIPEFDIPGHTNALLIAYPEYSCKGEPLEMGEQGMRAFSSKAGRHAICAGKHKQTIPMIMDIFEEMQEVFPDVPLHIGGDERPKKTWENCEHCKKQMKKLRIKDVHYLQNWFLDEVSNRLAKKGIRTMAWAEHLKGGIPKNQIVQAWRQPSELPDAVKAGHQVVNSYHVKLYLDYPANTVQLEKHAPWMRGMRVSTHSIYNYEPVPSNLTEKQKKLVIGLEVPIWTETVKMDRMDTKVFPRLLAAAELAWSQKERRSWESFQLRFKKHEEILSALGIKYDKSDKVK